jgi:hypothetical protein
VAKSSKSKSSQKAKIEEAEIVEDALGSAEGGLDPEALGEKLDAAREEVLSDAAEAVETDGFAEELAEPHALIEDDDVAEVLEDVTPEADPVDAPTNEPEVEPEPAPEVAEQSPEHEPERAPEPAPEPVPAVAEPAEQKSGFMPLLLGGVIAAGLGYAVPTFLLPQDNDALVALQGEVATLATSLGTVETSASEAGAQAQAANDAVASLVLPDVAPLQQAAADLAAQLVGLEARIAGLEARPVGTDSNITEGEFANLRALLTEQQAASAALTADMERMAAMQAEGLANAETEALNAARAAQKAAALQVVRTAFDTGEPFEPAVSTLTDVPEALAAVAPDGVPTAESLQSEFPDLARGALAVSRAAAAEGDAAGSIMAFVQKQVGARSVTPREGDDPDAVLSRAEAAVRDADWATALTEIAALPDVAQNMLAEWVGRAETRAAALSALSDFEATN